MSKVDLLLAAEASKGVMPVWFGRGRAPALLSAAP